MTSRDLIDLYKDQCWYWIPFYQRYLRELTHAKNRRYALRQLARSVVRFDRAERAQ